MEGFFSMLSNMFSLKTFDVSHNIKKKLKDNTNQYFYKFNVSDKSILDNNKKFSKKLQDREFVSGYTCGNSKSYKTIQNTKFQNAIYDCTTENKLCESSKLVLDNSGTLTLYSNDVIVWYKTFKIGDIDETRKADLSEPYKRNHLLTGETLEPGQWIGSPSGNCYLEFERIKSVNQNLPMSQLVVKYKISECNNTGNRAHTVENVDKQHINEIAYINEAGEKQFYPQSMTKLSKDYFDLGKSNSYSTNGNLLSLDDCKKKCNNDMNCYGVEHDDNLNTCYIRNNDILYSNNINSKKKFNSIVDLYMRKKNIKNHNSCSKEVSKISIPQLNSIPATTIMSKKTICGLNQTTITQRKIMEEKQSDLNTIIDKVKSELPTLYNNNNTLHNNIVSQLNNNDDDLKQIKNMDSMLSNKKINNPSLDGQSEDVIKNVNSERYYYILMIIISIIFIMMSIRLAT
jgi:uncharacterized coiled-coil protein SlyX